MEEFSKFFGMNLSLYALRMPLSTLQTENKDGLIHYIISESHHDYQAINEAYYLHGQKHDETNHASDCAPFKKRLWLKTGSPRQNSF